MGIHVHEFITLDGVIETPSWTAEYAFDPRMGETLAAITGACTDILLGRRTYEMFAPAWSTRTPDQDPGASFFNDSPKHVVSSSLESADWSNTAILGPYDPDAIRALKDRAAGHVYVSGSATLVRALLADGLVDQLHLFVYPLTLGTGLRLFEDGADPLRLGLGACDVYDSGVLHLVYGPASG